MINVNEMTENQLLSFMAYSHESMLAILTIRDRHGDGIMIETDVYVLEYQDHSENFYLAYDRIGKILNEK